MLLVPPFGVGTPPCRGPRTLVLQADSPWSVWFLPLPLCEEVGRGTFFPGEPPSASVLGPLPGPGPLPTLVVQVVPLCPFGFGPLQGPGPVEAAVALIVPPAFPAPGPCLGPGRRALKVSAAFPDP